MNKDSYTPCTKCGRPMRYCKGECCGKKPEGCDCREYGCKHNACIREKNPECPYEAVIPSVTIETINNLKDLADCFVHVEDINTTFYIDDKHRIMVTWAGLVSADDYDFDTNPLNVRSQIIYDAKNNKAAIYDNKGAHYIFQISDIENDYMLLENKPAINGVTLEGDKSLKELDIPAIEEVALTFDTVADMQASDKLVFGGYARTLGFHSLNDGGGALYKITNSGTADGGSVIALSGDLKAHLILTGDIKPELFGAYGDGTHNDTDAFNLCLAYTYTFQSFLNNEITGREVKLTKDYLIDKISIPHNMQVVRIIGEKARIRTGGFTFDGSTGWRVLIKGITFEACVNPINFDERNLEYGRYEISECIFRNCSGVCIKMLRRSCQATVEKCTFRACEKTAYLKDVDMFIFRDNWLECTSAFPWGDNHADVEQYAPIEGSMIIENNMFIPGYVQTATNPCWIKVGGTAIIKNNRFSGENTSIHPVFIDYDKYDSFNVNSTIHPIVDFIDNPIVTGNCPLVLNHCCGTLNIKNNSGWAGGHPILRTLNADADTYFTNLDYRNFAINIGDNGGRSFVFRDGAAINVPAIYTPWVATVLQRFIKTSPIYAGNFNPEIKTSITNYTLTLECCSTDIQKGDVFLVNGYVNKNPGGAAYYEPFLALVTVDRYYDGELRYRATAQIVTANRGNVSLTCQINGSNYVTALPAGENLVITMTGTGTARFYFKTAQIINMVPIDNKLVN